MMDPQRTPTPSPGEPDVVGLSVVVPVHNEVENLEPLVAELLEVLATDPRRHEILLVDDGSTDGSGERARELARRHPSVRALALRAHGGQSAALAAGFRAARGALLATLDADLQNDAHDLPALVAVLDQEAGTDAAIGWRVRRRDSWVKRVSSRIANGVRNRVSRESVRDTGCSLRVFRRACVEGILPFNGMHRFLPTLFRLRGFRVAERPVGHRPRARGRSHYNIRNRLWRGWVDLLAVRWLKDRYLRPEALEFREE